MLRKTLFFIFAGIFALVVILPVYHYFAYASLCQQLTEGYFKSPPPNPVEYSIQQEGYDELCGSGNFVDWFSAGFAFVGMVITAGWKKKKRVA